jgi:hypothetical protein
MLVPSSTRSNREGKPHPGQPYRAPGFEDEVSGLFDELNPEQTHETIVSQIVYSDASFRKLSESNGEQRIDSNHIELSRQPPVLMPTSMDSFPSPPPLSSSVEQDALQRLLDQIIDYKPRDCLMIATNSKTPREDWKALYKTAHAMWISRWPNLGWASDRRRRIDVCGPTASWKSTADCMLHMAHSQCIFDSCKVWKDKNPKMYKVGLRRCPRSEEDARAGKFSGRYAKLTDTVVAVPKVSGAGSVDPCPAGSSPSNGAGVAPFCLPTGGISASQVFLKGDEVFTAEASSHLASKLKAPRFLGRVHSTSQRYLLLDPSTLGKALTEAHLADLNGKPLLQRSQSGPDHNQFDERETDELWIGPATRPKSGLVGKSFNWLNPCDENDQGADYGCRACRAAVSPLGERSPQSRASGGKQLLLGGENLASSWSRCGVFEPNVARFPQLHWCSAKATGFPSGLGLQNEDGQCPVPAKVDGGVPRGLLRNVRCAWAVWGPCSSRIIEGLGSIEDHGDLCGSSDGAGASGPCDDQTLARVFHGQKDSLWQRLRSNFYSMIGKEKAESRTMKGIRLYAECVQWSTGPEGPCPSL